MKLITLTTDFGTNDWFVGTMKGVIQSIAPNTNVVDITHGIPAGDVRAGAFALAAAAGYFPSGTIHVGVVDPGVGGARAGLVIQTDNAMFVGPDNGLFSYVLRGRRLRAVHVIQNPRYQLSEVSRTFHGRDVFAPVAAHLSRGVPPGQIGNRAHEIHPLVWPEVKHLKNGIRGEVIYVDHFGNCITNLTANTVLGGGVEKVRAAQKLIPLRDSYGAVPSGRPVAVVGSSGLLEIAVNGGNAAKALKLRIGAAVNLPGVT